MSRVPASSSLLTVRAAELRGSWLRDYAAEAERLLTESGSTSLPLEVAEDSRVWRSKPKAPRVLSPISTYN